MKLFGYYLSYYKNRERRHRVRDVPGKYAVERSTLRKVWPWGIVLGVLVCACIGILSLLLTRCTTNKGILENGEFRGELAAAGETGEQRVLACYYNTVESGAGGGGLHPSQLSPRLCTHLLVAFARVHACAVSLAPGQPRALIDLAKLKLINPNLKIMLSIGGAGEQDGFPDMVKDHASRKMFIKSIKNVLKNYTLDGIDLDWEFPVLHQSRKSLWGSEVNSSKTDFIYSRERQHFSQLLREIRMEFIREKRNYILSVALAGSQTIVDVSYDVDQIDQYVDFANIMTYDFHSFTNFTPFTGLNAPLYARPTEGLFLATLNINYTIHMYQSKGLRKDKILVGIPTYGHTFTLVNEGNPAVGSPASGFGALGSRGFVDYSAVCEFVARAGAGGVQRRWEAAARVPYLYRAAEWLSCEEPRSVRAKADYVMEHSLRGAMIYSLNADDYEGVCADPQATGTERFPLTTAAAQALRLLPPLDL